MAKPEATVEEIVGVIKRGEFLLPEMQCRNACQTTRAGESSSLCVLSR